jgi:hypothetical protein
MTPRRIRWFLSLQDVFLTTTAHIAHCTPKLRRTPPTKQWWQLTQGRIEVGIGKVGSVTPKTQFRHTPPTVSIQPCLLWSDKARDK